MRKTREEIIAENCWVNIKRNDIVEYCYGDVPLRTYTEKDYTKYKKADGTLANILAVDAYIYSVYGDYDIYDILCGKICIEKKHDNILYGEIKVKYNGNIYYININNMYGLKGLGIKCLHGGWVTGWCNVDDAGSSANKYHTKEMDKDMIEKILNHKSLKDYGISVKRFIDLAWEIYNSNSENQIMNKTFEL